jgi:hypothetical protein
LFTPAAIPWRRLRARRGPVDLVGQQHMATAQQGHYGQLDHWPFADDDFLKSYRSIPECSASKLLFYNELNMNSRARL